MEAAERINQAFERALDSIREHVLPRLSNPKLGKKIGQWTILLFFTCLIRPTDLTGEGRVPLPFKRLGIVYALAPATLYAFASVEMFKHFRLGRIAPPPDSPFAQLVPFLGMDKVMSGLALLLILSAIYLLGFLSWAYNQLLCRLLGPSLAKAERASLAYFTLKSSAAMGSVLV
jgi:hypothetical protein